MQKSKEEIAEDVEQTRSQAKRALRNAGEVWSGKNAVASAWRSTKGTYFRAQDKMLDVVDATDYTVRSNVYASLGVSLIAGAILGFLMTNKPSRKKKR